MSRERAWKQLGLYGGDDGLTAYPDPDVAERVMRELDLKFKCEVKAVGETIGFLGRTYLDPWTHEQSHHDILRAVAKLHFSATNENNATVEQMLWRKAVSVFVTDRNTPILGEWSRKVLDIIPNGVWKADWKDNLYELGFAENEKLVSAKIIERFPEPIFPGPSVEHRNDILRRFVEGAPISLRDIETWLKKLKKAKTLDEFPAPLWRADAEPVGGYPVQVDDVVVGPPMQKSMKTDCFHWLAGKCARGKTCHFFHDPAKEATAEVCKDHLGAGCKREMCVFTHPEVPVWKSKRVVKTLASSSRK